MNTLYRQQDVPIYDSTQRRTPLVEEFVALVQYRDLVTQLIARNIKTRYKRSVLGIAWTMLNPLMTMTVMALVFSSIFVSAIEHYPVYVLAGLIFWSFFAQTTSAIMSELIWGGSLLNRIYVPRTVFAISALGTGLVNLVLALLPLALIMLISGASFTATLLFLPVPVLLISMFALGLGLFLSTVAVQFTDVVDMYQIVLTAWMYLTPIIYPIEIIPESNRWLVNLNPMYHLLQVFRQPIHDGRLPDLQTAAVATLIAVLTLIGGFWFFARKADEIAYRI